MKKTAAVAKAPNQLSQEREEELLDGALSVFSEEGLGGATIDKIAKRCRINKVTIYRRYKDKYDLFETVIERAAERRALILAQVELDHTQPIESLHRAALGIRSTYDSRLHLEMTRLIIAEAVRHPEICKRARALMVSTLSKKLIGFFEALVTRGQMASPYPKEAAISFVLLFSRGFRPLFDALGSEEEEQRQFEADMTMFLRGNGITAEPGDQGTKSTQVHTV